MNAGSEPGAECPLCGTLVTPEEDRCPSCGLTRPAARGSGVVGKSGLWFLAVMFVAIYALVLATVAAAR
jgi:hypothetical protein